MKRGSILIEISIALAMLVAACWSVNALVRRDKQQQNAINRAAYTAWAKQTGNPKELTYAEWQALMTINGRQHECATPTLILMPSN